MFGPLLFPLLAFSFTLPHLSGCQVWLIIHCLLFSLSLALLLMFLFFILLIPCQRWWSDVFRLVYISWLWYRLFDSIWGILLAFSWYSLPTVQLPCHIFANSLENDAHTLGFQKLFSVCLQIIIPFALGYPSMHSSIHKQLLCVNKQRILGDTEANRKWSMLFASQSPVFKFFILRQIWNLGMLFWKLGLNIRRIFGGRVWSVTYFGISRPSQLYFTHH